MPEANALSLPAQLVTLVAGGGLVLLTSFYLLWLRPWRPRRAWQRRVPAVDLLFVLGLALATASLARTPGFAIGARQIVHTTELPATLAGVDARIAEVEALPSRIWEEVKRRLAFLESLGLDMSADPPAEMRAAVGPFESLILPTVVNLVEILLRAFAYGAGVLAMLVAQVMRWIVRPPARPAAPTAAPPPPVRSLDERVHALEAALATLQAGPPGAAT